MRTSLDLLFNVLKAFLFFISTIAVGAVLGGLSIHFAMLYFKVDERLISIVVILSLYACLLFYIINFPKKDKSCEHTGPHCTDLTHGSSHPTDS